MWKSCSCQHMPKNVFLINQISWVFFFLYTINHFCFLWNSLVHGFFSIPFFLANSKNFFSSYFLLLFPLLSESPWPWEKSGVLPSGYLPTGLPCPPSVSSASWLHLLLHPNSPPEGQTGPQQNCDQNQSHCLGESLPHRDTSWQCLPRNLNSRRRRASHRGREIQHQIVARGL